VTYEEKDDGQLVTLIVESDRAALEALYGRYSAPIFSLAMNMLRDQGAAEEVTQDVFFNVWRRAASYREQRGKVTSWLFSIAHHRSIDEVRRRRRQQTHVQFGVDLSNRPSTDGVDPVEYATSRSDSGIRYLAVRQRPPGQGPVHAQARAARRRSAGLFQGADSHGNSEAAGPAAWHGQDEDPPGAEKNEGGPGP